MNHQSETDQERENPMFITAIIVAVAFAATGVVLLMSREGR